MRIKPIIFMLVALLTGAILLVPIQAQAAGEVADISVAVTDSPDPVIAGGTIAYTITMTNNGPDSAPGFAMATTLPAGTVFVSCTAPAGFSVTTPAVGSGGTVNATTASLASGSSGTLTLTVGLSPMMSGAVMLTASVSTSASDLDPSNDTATASTTILTYNNNDFNKLQAFLETESAVSGVKNGQQLNAAYDPLDPVTWTGVVWNDDISGKRVVSIGEDYSWQYRYFAGSLDLSGFTALEYVNCSGFNQLTALNVSGDTALVTLYCFDSQLTALDVSTNTVLRTLHCSDNPLGSLDISQNTSLRNLFCQNCGLGALDLSHAPDLYYLDCSKNALPSLNTSANTFLAYYFCNGNLLSSLDASANPNLVYLDFSANRLKLIKAKVSGRNITLQANTGGYVELFGTIDESVLNASGAPFAGASFFNWTAGSSIVSTDAAYPLSGGGDVSLLANFAYTVTFDKNGGETGPDSVAVLCGGILDAPPVQPTRAGYTFGGWYKEQACATIWNFSADTVDENTVLYAKWTALPITDLPQTYTMYKSGRVTWNPQPSGGTWDWDEDFFSAAFNGGATFTALKTGTSTITYTFGGSTQSVTITIMPAELPATGQDFTWVYILLGLAVCMLGTGIFFDKRASRKKRV